MVGEREKSRRRAGLVVAVATSAALVGATTVAGVAAAEASTTTDASGTTTSTSTSSSSSSSSSAAARRAPTRGGSPAAARAPPTPGRAGHEHRRPAPPRPRATARRATRPDTAAAEWSVWTTTARLVVTDPAALPAARALVEERLAAVDSAASRFAPTPRWSSRQLLRSPARRCASAHCWPTSWRSRSTPRSAPQEPSTPRSGSTSRRSATTPTSTVVRARAAAPAAAPAAPVRLVRATAGTDPADIPRRRGVARRRRPARRRPGPGSGGGGAAVAARRGAARPRRHRQGPCRRPLRPRRGRSLRLRALVSLGGDVATAGREPSGGWQVDVQDGDGEPRSRLAVGGVRGVATSSTLHRRWATAHGTAHHVLDPGTGLPAEPVWRTASVVAPSCAEANALSTAALVLGSAAPAWLDEQHATARLVGADGPRPPRRALARRAGGGGAAVSQTLVDALWYFGRGTGVAALALSRRSWLPGCWCAAATARPVCRGPVSRAVHRLAEPVGAGLPRGARGDDARRPYAQLALVDVVVPFLGAWNPFWLGPRHARAGPSSGAGGDQPAAPPLGLRAWRTVHWAAYLAGRAPCCTPSARAPTPARGG